AVYYRVYSPDGAIPSNTAFDTHNPFVGRIAARSVPPPHNAKSLKRCLIERENFTDPDGSRTALYPNFDARSALDPTQTVTILGTEMPNGGAPETAYALVLHEDLKVDENSDQQLSGRLYYQLFTQTDEDMSKASFNSNEPAVGRIERILVSPPHGPASIKRHIAKVEGKPIYAYSELYEDISAQQAMNDGYFSLIKSDGAGWAEDKPMVLVQPERRPGLF
ncbi:hypothetical protein B0H19DRAFT_895175, partial [Mycena capillaripes]